MPLPFYFFVFAFCITCAVAHVSFFLLDDSFLALEVCPSPHIYMRLCISAGGFYMLEFSDYSRARRRGTVSFST